MITTIRRNNLSDDDYGADRVATRCLAALWSAPIPEPFAENGSDIDHKASKCFNSKSTRVLLDPLVRSRNITNPCDCASWRLQKWLSQARPRHYSTIVAASRLFPSLTSISLSPLLCGYSMLCYFWLTLVILSCYPFSLTVILARTGVSN